MTVIVLSGPVGAGKSSLTAILSKYLGTKPFYESVDDNPVLPLFYKDPLKYTYLLQLFFLNTRFHSIKKALSDDNNVLANAAAALVNLRGVDARRAMRR